MKIRCRGLSLCFAFNPRARALCVLVAGLTLVLASQYSRGDELTRRVQEELRKRNLYFGEVDGRISDPLGQALRRYQQRKGFSLTGQPDEQTVSSLGLGAPGRTPAATVAQAASPWPDVPVLRSDAAREVAEKDRALLEQLEATDPEPAPVAEAPDPDLESEAASVPPPPAPPAKEQPANQSAEKSAAPPQTNAPEKPAKPPVSASAGKPPAPDSTAEIETFVREYLAACETNRIPAEMAFYADRVNYFDHGAVGRGFLEKDLRSYYKRWPKRDYTLERLIVLPPASGENEFTVKFRIRFDLKGAEGPATGRTENTFKIRKQADGLKFTSLRERRLRG